MTDIGISYRTLDEKELHLIGGATDIDAALAEARRGLITFNAHHAVIYRGRTAAAGAQLAIVSRD